MTRARPDADATVRIGCSGWLYDDWRGRVHPTDLPKTEWLRAYADLFDTVELNATFYRLPDISTVESWASRVPPGFRFAVKLGQFGTHRKKLRDPAGWMARHVEHLAHLGDRMGPNLVQLPPRWSRDLTRLDEFLEVAGRTGWRWAVELRDPSWIHDDTFALLERHGVALCLQDLLPDHPIERTAPWTYLRFHGPHATTDPYRDRYGPERLAPWAQRIDGWREEGVDVFAYFNNDYDAHALSDARWLRRAVGVTPATTPAPGPPGWVPWGPEHQPTEFQAAVLDVVAALEPGELVTYGDVADEVGRPGGGQAVANVLRHAVDVPWWRVVPAGGRLYRSHEPTQRPPLEDEGHVIDEDRRILA